MFKQLSLPKFLTAQRGWSYGEVGQINALRWQIYHYNHETHEMTPQSGLIKCKDFFNDLVASYHGKPFSIYGFDSTQIQLNEEGVYFLLHNIVPSLKENLEGWIVPLVKEELGCDLTFTEVNDQLLLFIPRRVFDKTYYISLLSLLIRASNYEEVFPNFEAVWIPTKSGWEKERPQWVKDNKAPTWRFTLPESAKDFWMYAGEKFNSTTLPEKITGDMYTVHNNGILNWSLFLKD
jgi:hypothetical protein